MATTSNKLSNVPKPSYSDRIASDANLLYVSRSVGNVRQATLVDMVYPVGSIYISVNTTNPGTLFGGTWEQIKDRFILAAGGSYTVGSTGGEATHKLTVDEMPSHRHVPYIDGNTSTPSFRLFMGSDDWYNDSDGLSNFRVSGAYTPRYKGFAAKTDAVGGSAAHNNMPPYLAVYMWKRTA